MAFVLGRFAAGVVEGGGGQFGEGVGEDFLLRLLPLGFLPTVLLLHNFINVSDERVQRGARRLLDQEGY